MYGNNSLTDNLCTASGNAYFKLTDTVTPTSCVSIKVTCFSQTKINKITL